MSDSSSEPDLLSPLSIPEHPFHARLPSNASTISSLTSSLENSPTSSRKSRRDFYAYPSHADQAYYPYFVLYPPVDQEMSVDTPNYFATSPANFSPKPVGLIQPRGSSFTHHG